MTYQDTLNQLDYELLKIEKQIPARYNEFSPTKQQHLISQWEFLKRQIYYYESLINPNDVKILHNLDGRALFIKTFCCNLNDLPEENIYIMACDLPFAIKKKWFRYYEKYVTDSAIQSLCKKD